MRISVTLFYLLLSLLGQAQIQKGKKLLGGQLSYSNYKADPPIEQKSSSGTFGVSLGQVYKDNRVVGFKLNYAPTKNSYLQSDTSTRTQRGNSASVFVRRYKELGKGFYFFGEGEVGYYYSNIVDEFNSGAYSKYVQNGINLTLNTGVNYFLTDKLMLEISLPSLMGLQYGATKTFKDKGEPASSQGRNFSLYSGLSSNASLSSLGFGFKVLL